MQPGEPGGPGEPEQPEQAGAARSAAERGAQGRFDARTLRYDGRGLVPVIAQDAASGEVLMLAWMNAEAIRRTLDSGRVTYWSRSRQEFWVKGATSGHVQELVEMRLDCDRDCLLVLVRQTGPACHTGRRSCFHTALRDGGEVVIAPPLAGPAAG
ncbi:MAG: phosphoribosyl-AMP cyclohydrolase [Roseovarius sp.]